MSGWYWQCKRLGVESKKKKKPLWTCVEDPVKFHGSTEFLIWKERIKSYLGKMEQYVSQILKFDIF